MVSLIFLTTVLSCVLAFSTAVSNDVLVQFDLVELPDWKEVVCSKFKMVIAESTTAFCNANTSKCGMKSQRTFTKDNVIIISGYPREKDVNSLMLFHINLPHNDRVDEDFKEVKKEALKEIVKINRKSLQNALIKAANEPYEASFRVSYVDEQLVLEMSDQTLNTIITPIVCAIVLIMAISIVILETIKRRKERAHIKKIMSKNQKNEPLLKMESNV